VASSGSAPAAARNDRFKLAGPSYAVKVKISGQKLAADAENWYVLTNRSDGKAEFGEARAEVLRAGSRQ
jgi:hypothetical protein